MIAGRDDEQEQNRARFQRDVRDGELVRAGRLGQAEDLAGTSRPAASAYSTGASRSSAPSRTAPGRSRDRRCHRPHPLHRPPPDPRSRGPRLPAPDRRSRLRPRPPTTRPRRQRVADLPLRELAHPSLERLARSTGESAQLYVRDGDRRVCIDAAESVSELRTIVETAPRSPSRKGRRARSSSPGPARPIAPASSRPPTIPIGWNGGS